MPEGLKKVTKKAQHQAKVDSLDSLGMPIGEFIQVEGLTVIEGALSEFVERVQKNMAAIPNFITTGSITDLSVEVRNNEVVVIGPKHILYQSRGVSGINQKYDTPHTYTDRIPPVEVFKEWIKSKKIIFTPLNDKARAIDKRLTKKQKSEPAPFSDVSDEEKDINKVAWGMAKGIYKKGIKPKNFFEKEYPKLIEDMQEQVKDFAVQSIVQNIDVTPHHGGGSRIILKKR